MSHSRTVYFSSRAAVLFFGLTLVSVAALFSQSSKVRINESALKLFRPLPAVMESADNPITDAKVKLGRMLYYEKRLSANHQVSCNTCHPLDAYGSETESVSTGFKNQKGSRNAPTVYNAAGHFVQFWDGRAATVEEQAKGPVLNSVEMALTSDAAAVRVLSSIPEYVALFKEAFPKNQNPVSFDNMAFAIGAFERGLITPSRWDRFLSGDESALSDDEKTGFNRFVAAGCATCHNGAYVGGNSFQRLGIAKPWPNESDAGRAQVTNQDADRLVFKVPSLRNISKTGPYFHDGSVSTLDRAIREMAVHQRGSQLSSADVKSIITWLNCLIGQIPAAYIKPPELPTSTDTTPGPITN